jgi:hypothetical protein
LERRFRVGRHGKNQISGLNSEFSFVFRFFLLRVWFS